MDASTGERRHGFAGIGWEMTRSKWLEIETRFGPQCKSDSPFMRRCRLLQSWYRIEIQKQKDCGPWNKSGRCVGNALVDGRTTGANFITRQAFAYATSKVAEKRGNRDLTIDEHRLFNNMLSSQPMCFNLFSDLRAGIHSGSMGAQRTVAAMFSESRIESVESLEVEMIPRPTGDYIGDKTAFDAAILFHDVDGRAGLASIETKYTDHLGTNPAKNTTKQWTLAEELGLFTPEGHQHYRAAIGFDQIARNFLLTLAYARKHAVATWINYVVALEEDKEARDAVNALRSRLAEPFRDRIVLLPLETLVSRGLAVADPPIAEVLTEFHRRYLEFSPLDAILKD